MLIERVPRHRGKVYNNTADIWVLYGIPFGNRTVVGQRIPFAWIYTLALLPNLCLSIASEQSEESVS
jgi:hypothetical protein